MTVYTQVDPPNVGVVNDRWVDSYDTNKIWLIHTAYDESATFATLTVPAASRPAAALVFTTLVAGNIGRNIEITITDIGPTGTSTLVKTGTGVRGDPYVYTFETYQDDNSNDAIIALLSGDADLAATGANATSADCTDVDDSLDNGVMDNLYAYSLVFRYHAPPPALVNVSSTIPECIPANVRAVLADGLAARMSRTFEGAPMSRSAGAWEERLRREIMKAKENQPINSYPQGLRVR